MTIDPSKQSAAVSALAGDWDLIDGLIGGTAAMRKAGPKYLPQFPKETTDAYRARLSQAVLFPAFARTSSTLAAKPLSRPIGLKDVPSNVEALLSNVDMLGTPLQTFAGQVMRGVMQKGLEGVLVDHPPRPENVRTQADEIAAGLRPYMARYPAGSILGWRARKSTNGATLTQLRLLETVTDEGEDFGEQQIRQVRILTPGFWQVWREVKNERAGMKEWMPYQWGETSLQLVPFVFFYGIREDFGIGKPPLIDLANLNVRHWQTQSDQDNILHVARVPVLFAKGFADDDEITIGASTAAKTSNPDADLKYVEHTGAAISSGRQSILDLEDRMRQAGAELLVQRPMVTATQVRSEDEGNRSILQEIAEEFEDSLEACLKLMGEYLGEQSDPKVELYKDFGSADLAGKGGDLLLRAAKDGHISSQTVFDHLKRQDVIDPERTWEEEQQRLAAEGTDA